jgi:hypothetical protein
MVREKLVVALVNVARGKSVEVVDKVGSVTEARPTEIPCGEEVSATSGDVMAKPIEQPGVGHMLITEGDEARKSMEQGDPGGMSAVSNAGIEDNQSEPIVHGCKRAHDQSQESVEWQDGVGADWRRPLLEYLRALDSMGKQNIRRQVLKYTMMEGELYQRTLDGLLLKCLNEDQARIAMREVHEGMCGAHQSAQKMKWAIQRVGMYWPSMVNDCIRYKKGFEDYQRFGDVQTAPASMLHLVVKVWSFRGWGLDFVREVRPSSPKGHRFGHNGLFYQVG